MEAVRADMPTPPRFLERSPNKSADIEGQHRSVPRFARQQSQGLDNLVAYRMG